MTSRTSTNQAAAGLRATTGSAKPDALLHHSDQGSQDTSEHFQEWLTGTGITCSMSRSGNVWDNAAMESFFSSLKAGRIRGRGYRTRDDARAEVAIFRARAAAWVEPIEATRSE